MAWTQWQAVEGDGLAFEQILYEKKHHEGLGGGVARITINKPGIHLESYSLSEIGSFTLTLQRGPETLAYYLTHPKPPLRR